MEKELELELEPDPDYTKGFNEGYTIASHLPDVADKLSMVLGDTERGKGFQEGREQLIFEKDKEKYPAWLMEDKDADVDMDKEMDKDKDDYDLER